MKDTIGIEIPLEWMKGLPEDASTGKHIVRLGIEQLKLDRAIRMYRDGVGSPGYIADQMGLYKRDLVREMRTREIEPDFSEETLRKEMAG